MLLFIILTLLINNDRIPSPLLLPLSVLYDISIIHLTALIDSASNLTKIRIFDISDDDRFQISIRREIVKNRWFDRDFDNKREFLIILVSLSSKVKNRLHVL